MAPGARLRRTAVTCNHGAEGGEPYIARTVGTLRGSTAAGCLMTRQNPDRDFSATRIDEAEAESLRGLLRQSEPAATFDRAARQHIGEAIGRAVFKPDW
jgi:hypothetical protein